MKPPHGIASAFDEIRADYDATRQSRFVRRRTGVAPLGSSEDYHFRSETKYYELIEQARDMDRNDALVGILADRRVDNIVQSGFTLDPKTGDKKLDLELWERWEDFSNDPDQCDIAGEMTWKEIERQCCRSESIDGDIVVVGTEDGPFQLIEAHSIQTSSRVENTFLGVTRDQYRKRIAYYFREEIDQFAGMGQAEPIPVRNDMGIRQLFHVYNPKRVNATRGVTQLAPVFSLSGMLEDVNFAKLVQQQVVSCFAIFRKLVAGASALPSVDGYGDASTEQTPSGTRQIEGVSPGMEIIGRPGEELQGFSPNVPNSEYFQQVQLIMQVIGVNFGLPLCLVLMDGSETNFSGWRGAVDEARKGFVNDQQNLVRRLNAPAYRWKLAQWIEEDSSLRRAAERSGIDIYNHNWNLPTWSYIEPVADAEGDTAQLRNALTSPRRMHASRGKDWETIAEEIIEDNVYAIAAAQTKAIELNKKFKDAPPLTWRDLIPLPMPEGQTLALQDPAAMEEEAPEEGPPKPEAKAKKKVEASDGKWRTTEDGGKIFIGPDDEPRFGGPQGPPAKKTSAPTKRHSVALPSRKSKLSIDKARQAMEQMGYKLGAASPNIKERRTDYEVTSPDGTTSKMSTDEIKKLVYDNKAEARAQAQDESRQESEEIADILISLYGDDAEQMLFPSGPQARLNPISFDESKVKRDEKGRFASKGSAGALKAAKEKIQQSLTGPRTAQSANELAEKLSNLTVKQLRDLKQEYGIKASGPNKAALVAKLADRLDRARRMPDDEPDLILDDEEDELILDDEDDEIPPDVIREAHEEFEKEQQQQKRRDESRAAQAKFRQAVINESREAKQEKQQLETERTQLRMQESNLLQKIYRQEDRLRRANNRLAKNPGDQKAQKELELATKNLEKLQPEADATMEAMRNNFVALRASTERNQTIAQRMLKQEVEAVNSEDGPSAISQAQQNRQQIESVFAGDTQIEDGSKEEAKHSSDPEFATKSKELYATPEAKKTRDEARKVLLDVVNTRFHATALQAPLSYQSGARAHARYSIDAAGKKTSRTTLLSPSGTVSTFLHEYAHHVEYNNPEAEKLTNNFLKKRVAGEKPTNLKSKFGLGYDSHELGRKDDFEKVFRAVYGDSTDFKKLSAESKAYYAGKVYANQLTEILTLGVEMLHHDSQAFAEADPEYFDLVTGILSGRALEQSRGL